MDNKDLITRKGMTLEINREEFGLRLHAWRLRSAMSQSELAEKWGVSRYTIMRAEKGKRITWQTAYRLFCHLSEEQGENIY